MDRAELLDRINAAGVTTLGQVATIHTVDGTAGLGTAGHEAADEEAAEPDPFWWIDAARWRPGPDGEPLGDEELVDGHVVNSDRLDALFDEVPDEELGSVDELGWFGLVRYGDRPGGVVLMQNGDGCRFAWQTDSDDDLAAHWAAIEADYDAFYTATHDGEPRYQRDYTDDDQCTGCGAHLADACSPDCPRTNPEAAAERRSGAVAPRIWVCSMADYNAGRLHGMWLDANCDAETLGQAVHFILRTSSEAGAEEYGVFDYDDFPGGVSTELGEWPNLDVVSQVAQGMTEHGPAFGAWAAYVSVDHTEELDQFEDHYLGEYDSMEAYAEQYIEDCEGDGFMDQVPEWLQPYVRIDIAMLAQDMGYELHVVEQPDGGVWVFDATG